MKLTKKQEAEILSVYNEGWEAYMNGDLKTHGFHLSKNFKIIGSSAAEQFDSKKSWLTYCKKTIKQFAGVIQLKNRKIKLVPAREEVMVVENADIYVLIDTKWSFYSKIRITALLQKEKTGWKYIHQHGSLPDARANEGEVIATAKIKKENLLLKEAVKRRTAELELKNRELEIEAAMEKVRVRSLAMQKPEELADVAEVLRNEMGALGVEELETSSIYILDDAKETTECWYAIKDVRGKNKKLVTDHMKLRLDETWVGKQMQKFYRSKQARTSILMKGEKRKAWINYCAGKSSVLQGYYGDEIPERTYHLLKFSNGFMGAASPGAISHESWDLLQRATAVFSFAYKRFSDLQKAEAQAREAQIEAALERVRSRSMAMHQSEELREVLQLIFEQLRQLNFNIDSAQFNLNYKESDDLNVWTAIPGQPYPTLLHIPFIDTAIMNSVKQAKEKQLAFFSHTTSFEEKNEFFEHFFNHVEGVPEERKKYIFQRPGYARSIVFLDNLFLGIQNYAGIPYSDTENAVLTRFAKVFEQSYTRFLDLQKAEAQAREAQIEAALERVRSTSLAMHKSHDLSTVVYVVFSELVKLDAQLDRCLILTVNPKTLGTTWYLTGKEGLLSNNGFLVPNNPHPSLQAYLHGWRTKRKKWHYLLAGEEKRLCDAYIFFQTELHNLPDFIKADMASVESIHLTISSDDFGCLIASSLAPLSDTHAGIVERFAVVFNQTYTRFLDLQKAEAQAREAQIQLSLERVRSRAMAMHHTDELSDVLTVLFEQFDVLGISPVYTFLSFIDPEKNSFTYRQTGRNGTKVMAQQTIAMDAMDVWKDVVERWKAGNYDTIDTMHAPKELVPEVFHVYNEIYSQLPEGSKVYPEDFPEGIFTTIGCSRFGHLGYDHFRPSTEEEKSILLRFNTEFVRLYQRFLDLQKAEAQAREAQIEAALERVRSRSMAMHKSEELLSVITVVSEQLQHLNFKFNTVSFAINNQAHDYTFWFAIMGDPNPIYMQIPYIENPMADRLKDVMARGADFYSDTLTPEESKQWHEHVFAYADIPSMNEETRAYILRSGYARSMAIKPSIMLIVSNYAGQPYSDDQNEIIKRFATVFEQSYTRFLDLQKAEAQAREAQIEAALERVRSRSMAMHKSEDLRAVVNTLYSELQSLHVNFQVVGIQLLLDESKDLHMWLSTADGLYENIIHWPYMDLPVFHEVYKARTTGEMLDYTMTETITKEFFEEYFKVEGVPQARKMALQNVKLIDMAGAYQQLTGIFLMRYTEGSFSPHEKEIIRRFSKVFEQTYTRFLDLQKSEAQAREAQIEAALERVRGKAMAMHSSEDLVATIGVFYRELESLSITPRRCGVGLLDKEKHTAELSTMNTAEEGGTIELIGTMKLVGHPVLEGIYDNWILQKEYQPVLRGPEIKEYYQVIRPQIAFPEYPNDAVHYGYFFYFTEGGVYAWTEKQLNEDELKTYRRFTSVLSLTYKRYKDLKDAEAREKEAIKQAALDRVRADIASMRSTVDLDRITPLIWKELTTLGISFIRCGVFIMDEKENKVHTYLSTPDGRAIAAFHTPMDDSGSLVGAIEHWRQQKVFVTHWVDSDFQTQADVLLKQGSITSRDQYLNTLPKEGFHLHFLPFRQGMLYVGSNEQLPVDALQLVQSLADAFSVAYARYEDFSKLESAKQQIEKTLTDLKQTQTQLIQSEKMASLGELTAGIAHEIQNPLNFVNNFSEVSNELIKEIQDLRHKTQANSSNTEEDELLNDIAGNLEKINHHGKRAADIVKGMLQHSRSSSGQKEPTDINALADEYLRLAYHGLRAKDKGFNATMKTDFDASIGNINIIPQDIGRVILNLITNAFYAVSEKSKVESQKSASSFDPNVTVSTKHMGDKIEISVKDNGNGIPEHIKDKIFQPFFTTKPTGQGTGLGLSLSYDIVKVHGGEIKMETTDNEGTTFTISLPIQ